MHLDGHWYFEENKNMSLHGKEARASQSHMHTTGSTSYANKRADFTETNAKIEELANSSSKSELEIQNEVFDSLMYEEGRPKKPVGFGLGVKESGIFGVKGFVIKKNSGSAIGANSCVEMENMRSMISHMKEENQVMKKENEELRAKVDQTNQILLQALNAMRAGVISNEFLNAAQAALHVAYSSPCCFY